MPDSVGEALQNIEVLLKEKAWAGTSAELKRCIEYMAVVEGLRANWNAGLPVSGKEKGKPGRRPKDAGGNDTSEDASTGSSEIEPVSQVAHSEPVEGTYVEDGMTFVEGSEGQRRRRA